MKGRVIDLNEGAMIMANDHSAARLLIIKLVESFPEVRQKLQHAYVQSNFHHLKKELHYLMGGLAYVGVPRLRYAAHELRRAIILGDSQEVVHWYQILLREMDGVQLACEAKVL